MAGGRQRHCVRFAGRSRTLIEPSHESRISPINPTSRVQFERPRVERHQATIAALRLADDIPGAGQGFSCCSSRLRSAAGPVEGR
jgi:hypothetical protein